MFIISKQDYLDIKYLAKTKSNLSLMSIDLSKGTTAP